jgi:hypothetical protein
LEAPIRLFFLIQYYRPKISTTHLANKSHSLFKQNLKKWDGNWLASISYPRFFPDAPSYVPNHTKFKQKHDVSFFRHWWSMVLANTGHQAVAESFS